jgi:hypothetical protein
MIRSKFKFKEKGCIIIMARTDKLIARKKEE